MTKKKEYTAKDISIYGSGDRYIKSPRVTSPGVGYFVSNSGKYKSPDEHRDDQYCTLHDDMLSSIKRSAENGLFDTYGGAVMALRNDLSKVYNHQTAKIYPLTRSVGDAWHFAGKNDKWQECFAAYYIVMKDSGFVPSKRLNLIVSQEVREYNHWLDGNAWLIEFDGYSYPHYGDLDDFQGEWITEADFSNIDFEALEAKQKRCKHCKHLLTDSVKE